MEFYGIPIIPRKGESIIRFSAICCGWCEYEKEGYWKGSPYWITAYTVSPPVVPQEEK